MKRCIFLVTLLTLVAGLAVTSTPALAQKAGRAGIEGGYGSNLDWYLGLRAEARASQLFGGSRAVVNFDWFFPEQQKARYYEFNLNYLFPLTNVAENGSSHLYFGAGINVGRGWTADVQDSQNWEFGLNALAGFNFNLGTRSCFAEGGYTFITDYDQWRIGVGFLM